MTILAAQAAARLGEAGSIDISVGRIIAAFLFCAFIALLAILLIRQRTGRGDLADWLRRVAPGQGAIEIVEVRRLTMHADIGLVRHAGREYLLVLHANANRVLREREIGNDPAPPA